MFGVIMRQPVFHWLDFFEADVNFRTGLKIHSKRNISSSNSSDIASALTTNIPLVGTKSGSTVATLVPGTTRD